MTRVAIQGVAGAFSDLAAQQHFGEVEILTCRTFEDAEAALEGGQVKYAVLPVENKIAGAVPGTQHIIARPDFHIVAEIVLPIHHFLMGLPGADLFDLRAVLSHPIALLQCTRFLAEHPHLHRTEWFDTAGAALHVAGLANRRIAAIAAYGAAARYGLTIIAENIEDRSDNTTRFAVLARAR